MNEFTIVTTVGRPVDEVFAVIRDVARTPVGGTWGLTEGRQTSEGPLEPARHARLWDVPRAELRDTAVCTAFSESKQFATKSTAGPFYIEIDTTMETGGGGYPGDRLLPGREPRLLQAGRSRSWRPTRKHFEAAADNLRALLD